MNTERKRTLVTVAEELSPDHLERLRSAACAHGFEALFFETGREAEPYLEDAEILFSADPSLIEKAPGLKWVCTPFAGIDRFAEPGVFDESRILLSNSSGAYGITISEHVIMVILEILRRMEDYHAYREEKRWKRDLPVRSIYGASVVIAGTGDIGRNIARRLRGFAPASLIGVNRSLSNPDALFDAVQPASSLPSLLKDTDILILTLPATSRTFHMIGEKELSCMKDDALLINVGRGSIVDEEALIRHLDSGRLFAGLDVFETEPLPESSPLWNHARALITPHCSGNMTLKVTVNRVVDQFLEDLDRYCNGLPLLHAASVKRGY